LSAPASPENRMVLQAGERGHCTKAGQLVKTLDPEANALSWLTQSLRFRNAPLPDALEALSRHYGIELSLEKETLSKCPYTGVFEQAPLQDVLRTLELTFGARIIQEEENRYLLRGGACGK
jgi:transmembrane sensor